MHLMVKQLKEINDYKFLSAAGSLMKNMVIVNPTQSSVTYLEKLLLHTYTGFASLTIYSSVVTGPS